jgi:site-specific DNA-cytosine methylase
MLPSAGGPGWRVVEFFAGIGGLACAWPEAEIRAAIDINQKAALAYRRNLKHRFLIREIESLADSELQQFDASFWWLSPPCQPFSRRGQRKDIEDARTRALLRLIDAIASIRPTAIGLENVIGFADSQAAERLLDRLDACGYQVMVRELCPSQMQWPNRRPRYYLLASLERLPAWQPLPTYQLELSQLVEDSHSLDDHPQIWLPAQQFERFAAAIDRIDSLQVGAISACFASSYGKTLLQAGSYLRSGDRYRRFTPREVARLLGFPETYCLQGLGYRTLWKLLGNSLSLPAVRYVLSHLPGGPTPVLNANRPDAYPGKSTTILPKTRIAEADGTGFGDGL